MNPAYRLIPYVRGPLYELKTNIWKLEFGKSLPVIPGKRWPFDQSSTLQHTDVYTTTILIAVPRNGTVRRRGDLGASSFEYLDFGKFGKSLSNVPATTLGVQSTLSKADTLGTKATVRFREVSALERVQLQRYKCNSAGSGPNLLSGLERCPV